jgi:hypothetical protein
MHVDTYAIFRRPSTCLSCTMTHFDTWNSEAGASAFCNPTVITNASWLYMLAYSYTILFTASLTTSIYSRENHMDEHLWIHLLPWRKKIREESTPSQIKFVPKLRITRRDGWVHLELQLSNRSSWTVWVEEATVVLADLDANWQTAVPEGQVSHKIRQNVVQGDVLNVSLAAAIYDAAGRPQGKYSCLVFTEVCYRVFKVWCKAKLDPHRVEMAAHTVIDLRGVPTYAKKT